MRTVSSPQAKAVSSITCQLVILILFHGHKQFRFRSKVRFTFSPLELSLVRGARIRVAERKGSESIPGTATSVHKSPEEGTAWEATPRNSVR